jgi:predicted aspartyl protease
MTRIALFAAAVLVTLEPGIEARQHQHRMGPPPPERVELSGAEASVPMDSLGGRPLVQVTFGGKGPFKFIFDSGAAGMVITDELADELDLEVLGEALVGSPAGGKPTPGRIVNVPRLEMGGAQVHGIHAVAAPLPMRNPGDYRGVLSAALFPGHLVIFDFPAASLRIRPGELPAADDKEVFEYDSGERLPTVTIDVAGTRIDAHLDTGAAHGLSLPARYASTLALDGAPVESGKARLIDREVTVTSARLKGAAKLGRFTFDRPEVVFNEAIPMGNIGPGILRGFVMTLDRAHHRVRLEEKASPPS